MAELKDDGGTGGGGTQAKAPPDPTTEPGRVATLLAEINRLLEPTAEPDRTAGLVAEIDRLLEGFDDRLAVVNRRLDRVLERRA